MGKIISKIFHTIKQKSKQYAKSNDCLLIRNNLIDRVNGLYDNKTLTHIRSFAHSEDYNKFISNI